MLKVGGDRVVNCICRLRNMVFESNVAPEDWRAAVIVPVCKGKGERTECKNYGDISLLSIIKNIYIDRVHRVTGDSIN